MYRILRLIILIMGCLLLSLQPARAVQIDLNKIVIRHEPLKNVTHLYQTSDLIAYGWFTSHYDRAETTQTVSEGKLVNYIQTFHIKKRYKGSGNTIKVISTGVEPLPEPKNPLNKYYPGPIADGEYICFFKKVLNTNYYEINGGWQGTYPVINKHVLSLEEAGFKELSGLSLGEFENVLTRIRE